MKKFFGFVAIAVVITMLFTGITAFAADGDVEITFCVGDSTLMINGVAHTVEKPYVVGEGVTLVPVRVITEAFGAIVNWDHDTKSVTLEYPGVNIYLQINNPVAEVNGMAQTLLSAPELTNTSTMVPLRFISENFGAEVSYEPVTEKITVIKKASTEGSTVVSGGVDSANIGDSYYGWVMEKPADMQMDYRSFDGTYTSFMYDDDNYIYVEIYPADEEYDQEEDFAAAKESMEGLTLIKAEKSSNVGEKKIHVQAKNQLYYIDAQKIVTDKYEIVLYGIFENENVAQRDAWLKTMATFDVPYNGADTYDLSTVKNGVRVYEAKDINLTFNVPQELYMYTSEYAVNEFEFYSLLPDDNFTDLKVGVYSKSDVKGAYDLAVKDYESNKVIYNPDVVKFSSGVVSKQYATVTAYEYSYDYKSSVETGYFRDVFFELGDYVYNFAMSVKSTRGDMNAYADKIINSIKAEPIDSSEVGILLRNTNEFEGTYTSKTAGCELTLPKVYAEELVTGGAVYMNQRNSVTFSFVANKYSNSDFSDAKEQVTNYEAAIKNEDKITIINSSSDVTINGVKYAQLFVREETDSGYLYMHIYSGVKNGGLFTFVVYYPEYSYSNSAVNEIKGIIGSLK